MSRAIAPATPVRSSVPPGDGHPHARAAESSQATLAPDAIGERRLAGSGAGAIRARDHSSRPHILRRRHPASRAELPSARSLKSGTDRPLAARAASRRLRLPRVDGHGSEPYDWPALYGEPTRPLPPGRRGRCRNGPAADHASITSPNTLEVVGRADESGAAASPRTGGRCRGLRRSRRRCLPSPRPRGSSSISARIAPSALPRSATRARPRRGRRRAGRSAPADIEEQVVPGVVSPLRRRCQRGGALGRARCQQGMATPGRGERLAEPPAPASRSRSGRRSRAEAGSRPQGRRRPPAGSGRAATPGRTPHVEGPPARMSRRGQRR